MEKDYTATYDLLIECCRCKPDTALLESYSSNIDDWNAFLNSAYAHGIFPLVHKSLKLVEAVPNKIRSKLKSINFEIVRRNLAMTAELLKIMRLLEENDIPALAIKGPVLSHMIYGDITQRQYEDLDILFHIEDLYRVGELLLEHKYKPEHPIEFLKNTTLHKVAKDFTISNKSKNIHIELHWNLFLNRQIKKNKITFFNDNAGVYTINDTIISVLKPDIHLLYLLLHGSKHLWERMEWIVDIDRFIYKYGSKIDWKFMDKMAKNMDIELMFYLGLSICHKLFQTPLPDFIYTKITTYAKVISTTKVLYANLVTNVITNVKTKSIAFENLDKIGLIKNNKRELIRHYWLTLFGLKDVDVYIVNLPNQFSVLYYVIRLYRIFLFYVLQIKK